MNSVIDFIRTDRFFAIILIAISAFFFNYISGIDVSTTVGELATATYPQMVLGCIIVVSAIQLIGSGKHRSPLASFTGKGFMVILVIGAYIALLDIVGYFILTPIMLVLLPLLAGFYNKKLILISVVLVTCLLYAVFSLVLNIPLPTGLLGDI